MKESLNASVVRIEKFNPEKDLKQLANLYAEVFSGPPWNEYTKCVSCLDFFGVETKPEEKCPKCENRLVLAYPQEETCQYIMEEKAKQSSKFLVAKKGDEMVGFAWGYCYSSPEKFASRKYRTAEMQSKIVEILVQNDVFDNFFYFSECGVKTSQRNQKLSNQLSIALLENNIRLDPPIVLRTNWQSPMMAVADKLGMKQIMGPETMIDRIGNSIKPTGTIVNNLQDLEIEERVLFVLQ